MPKTAENVVRLDQVRQDSESAKLRELTLRELKRVHDTMTPEKAMEMVMIDLDRRIRLLEEEIPERIAEGSPLPEAELKIW